MHARFVWIDRVIDDLCGAVRMWYVAPELLSRPVIVNLWGMTGVGKTDLVRKLASALDILDRFVEIELTNEDGTTHHRCVADRLAESGALEGAPALLLFDEIQRFGTRHRGEPVPRTRFSAFWELLSDGRLSRRQVSGHEHLLARLSQLATQPDRDLRDGIGVGTAMWFKETFRVPDDLAEIASWPRPSSIAKSNDGATMSTEPPVSAWTWTLPCIG